LNYCPNERGAQDIATLNADIPCSPRSLPQPAPHSA
jgi:hypothetical protein